LRNCLVYTPQRGGLYSRAALVQVSIPTIYTNRLHEAVVQQNVMFPPDALLPSERAGSSSLVGLKRGSVPHDAISHDELHLGQREASSQAASAGFICAQA
jgi:hypothetical protein